MKKKVEIVSRYFVKELLILKFLMINLIDVVVLVEEDGLVILELVL